MPEYNLTATQKRRFNENQRYCTRYRPKGNERRSGKNMEKIHLRKINPLTRGDDIVRTTKRKATFRTKFAKSSLAFNFSVY